MSAVDVVDPDVDDLGVEDLVDLVADELVHRPACRAGRQALLDAVDDRQLGGPLVGLGQQALRLVEQAGVLERDAQARGERREQPLVGLAERVSWSRALESDHADRLVAGHDRHAEPRLSGTPPTMTSGFP